MRKLDKPYTFFVLSGCLLTSVEFILSLWNKSLCSNAGCKFIANYLKFNERYMYAIGFLFFLSLFISNRREHLQRFNNLLIISGIAAEGYLIGFQFFIANIFCLFCISVASIILILSLLKLFSGIKEPVITGFCIFLIIFSLVGAINSASTPISANQKYVLIYSKNCPHCAEVINFSKENKIPVSLTEADNVKNGLKWLGIDSVPVLIYNDGEVKKIYPGANSIKDFLKSTLMPPAAGEKAHSDAKPAVKHHNLPAATNKTPKDGVPEIFNKSYTPYTFPTDRQQSNEDDSCSMNTFDSTCK